MKAIVDCNSFYAACERLFKPSLHGKPVVVLSNNDGCIVSRTDEAKALGIQMAGPYYQNKEEIEKNKVAVFSSNYHLYGDLSWRVMETLRILSPHVEVYSVDESFLDLDGIDENKLHEYALFLKHTTELWTGIPVSIGVAPSKVLSKVANRLAKKDKIGTRGVMILQTPQQQMEALQRTAVEDVWGVGGASSKKLRLFNINTAWDLRNMSEDWARKNLGGVVGVRLIKELRGQPCIEMKDPLETKKMIATTRMFGKPVYELRELREAVATYITRAAEKLRRQNSAAKTISVFLVTNNYSSHYEYKPASSSLYTTLPFATSLTNLLIEHAMPLVEQLYSKGSKYLKAGVILSGIVPDNAVQFNLFEQPSHHNEKKLMKMIDNVNFSMRNDVLKFASSGTKRDWKMRQELRSPRYTTRWDELYKVR
ncbi:MAG: Y-family DNA polymerase [Chitinophagaceae bacterium]|nr:Y-family DNA polymerase [Chitinophagaceae bacterium]MBK9484292.1 Y-family DNA polymerase [Chitinophagaceae bacterium]MBL0198898.1 Y-family DNA polymerase [Chitinophagaceae bacterium]